MAEIKPTTATTAVPNNDHSITSVLPDGVAAGGITGAAVTLVAFLLHLRRRMSSDNTQISRDSAEKDLIQMLSRERDLAMKEARTAWDSRMADNRSIAELTERNRQLTQQVEDLVVEVAKLRGVVKEMKTALAEARVNIPRNGKSDYADL